MHIAVDIDGVLTLEVEGWEEKIYSDRIPNRENIHLVNELYDAGCRIDLFSARHEEDRRVTKRWLDKYGVRFHSLILGKPHYDAIVDDRASSLLALTLVIRERKGGERANGKAKKG